MPAVTCSALAARVPLGYTVVPTAAQRVYETRKICFIIFHHGFANDLICPRRGWFCVCVSLSHPEEARKTQKVQNSVTIQTAKVGDVHT